ncbi:MAG TPA: triose-phosphate isomerase [Geminicoccaceae bacterium]|nr:triose-phosphate isomerase [Geminicoccaceae bacterium]
MAPPRPVVLGNWKMNGLRSEGLALAGTLAERAVRLTGTLGLFPPATLLADVARRVAGTTILVGGQDCHPETSGAFTGSLSATMLKDAGAGAVLVGHSERRHGLGESDELVRAKAAAALAAGLLAVVCIGETEAEYLAGETHARLAAQLRGSLPEGAAPDRLVVAYEPVWAVGTGRTPSVGEIRDAHALIRAQLVARVPDGAAMRVLYGGSVKAANGAEIMAEPEVDGVLVGGASLDAREFWAIYQAGGGA